jgi:hypothetical protein
MSDEDLITQAIQDQNAEEDGTWQDDEGTNPQEDTYDLDQVAEEEPLILGKFQNVDDLAASYQELERQFHQRQNEIQQEYQPESETTFQPQFGNTPGNEDELVQWAATSPGEAATWTIQNQHLVPDELVNAVWQNWWEQAPWEASMYQMNSMIEQQQQNLSQTYEPIMEQHQNQILQSAIDNIRTSVPDFDEYAPQVADFVNTRDLRSFFPDNALDDPQALAEGLNAIVGIIKWREYQDSLANQVQYEDPEYRQQIATQTRSTVTPGDDASYDEQIQQMILNA